MKKKILIIDDDPMIGLVCRRLLDTHGYETDVALDGASGLERLRNFQPDAVFLDLMMPKVNGIVVLDWIRAQECFRNLPVIVLTNAAVPTLLEQAKDSGATRILDKSQFNPVAVTELLRGLLAIGPSNTKGVMSQIEPWKPLENDEQEKSSLTHPERRSADGSRKGHGRPIVPPSRFK